ncbi:MAG: hypothetical protein AAFV26_02675, partial [Pseudomonadota bacterium]
MAQTRMKTGWVGARMVLAAAALHVVSAAAAIADDRLQFDPSNVFGAPSASSRPLAPPGIGTPTIRWRLENPFRFFTDPRDTAMHRTTFAALGPDERRDPVLAAERTLSRKYRGGWAANLKGRTCWNARQNRHVCPDGGDYVNPKQHRIIASLEGLAEAD